MTDRKDLNYITKLPETRTQIILNQEQSQPQVEQSTVKKLVETAKEVAVPTVYASDDEEKAKEGVKQAVGAEFAAADAIAPPVGAIASGVSMIGGSLVEGIGKATGDKELQESGEVFKEAPVQPIKEAGKAVKKSTEE
jgi:uncharacterized protein YjbJ (UPF0337 family)